MYTLKYSSATMMFPSQFVITLENTPLLGQVMNITKNVSIDLEGDLIIKKIDFEAVQN